MEGGGEGPVMVHLRGLCEFPVRRLDFGPYPSVCVCVCVCTVAAAAPLPSVPRRLLKYRKSGSRMYSLDSVM